MGDEERKEAEKKKLNSIKEEIRSLKRQLVQGKDDKDDAKIMKPTEETLINEEEENNDVLKDFHMQQKKYAQQKIASKRKTEASKREEDTLALLKKFQKKLEVVKNHDSSVAPEDPSEDSLEDANKDSWLKHSLKFEDATPNV